MFEWLFGGRQRSEADALREEVVFLRGQVEKERVAHLEERRVLTADNARMRREIIALCNAGALAQIEAYRQQQKLPVTPQRATTDKPQSHVSDQVWAQDHAADDALPPEAMPSDEDLELEEQARHREELRLQGTAKYPQTVSETPEAEVAPA